MSKPPLSKQPATAKQPARSGTAGRSHAQPPPRSPRPPNTRRAQEAARRASKRRRSLFGYGTVGVVAVAVVAAVIVATTSKHTGSSATTVGAGAPDGSFTTVGGNTETVASLRGQPTLLWFVATWCSSCQAGTRAMASAIDTFDGDHVRVVELEMADDLGQSGPSISDFGQQLAGSSYTNPDWTWGTASSALTTTYNPKGYLDIYYLLNASGKIVYVNSSPGSTMGQLLAEAAALRSSTTSPGGPAPGASEQPAPAAMVQAATTVPASVAEAVGLPSGVAPPQLLTGQPPLTIGGKPAVVYVGAEYCPYCAAERWAAVVALSRFGTFSNLGETHSSDSDVFPGTITFSFYGSSYTSPYLAFDPTETNTNQPSPQGGYTALQALTGLAKTTFDTYDSPPYVPSSGSGGIPFYDIGNKVLISGASYSPQVLQGLSASEIAADLSDPSSPVAQAIVGAASYITAAICSITNGQPANVCQASYVTSAASALKLS